MIGTGIGKVLFSRESNEEGIPTGDILLEVKDTKVNYSISISPSNFVMIVLSTLNPEEIFSMYKVSKIAEMSMKLPLDN